METFYSNSPPVHSHPKVMKVFPESRHLIIMDSLLCPWGKKALTFSLNPVNTDTFNGLLSVCIYGVSLYLSGFPDRTFLQILMRVAYSTLAMRRSESKE